MKLCVNLSNYNDFYMCLKRSDPNDLDIDEVSSDSEENLYDNDMYDNDISNDSWEVEEEYLFDNVFSL